MIITQLSWIYYKPLVSLSQVVTQLEHVCHRFVTGIHRISVFNTSICGLVLSGNFFPYSNLRVASVSLTASIKQVAAGQQSTPGIV